MKADDQIFTTPGVVLNRIASVFHCPKDRIEEVLEELMERPIERAAGSEARLAVIRRALNTPEAASVIEMAQVFWDGAK
jgi:hypothetical protein